MSYLFISDTHFFHEALIKYKHRPFKSLDEMHSCIIDNWNSVVTKDNDVFHLGDFAYRADRDALAKLIKQLNGRIHIVWGNHDEKYAKKLRHMFASCHDDHYMKIGKQKIHLYHFPICSWRSKEHGSWHLHGHSHGKRQYPGLTMDVSVECVGYKPVTLAQVNDHMQKQVNSISAERSLLMELATHIRNTESLPALEWGAQGCDLLAKVRAFDQENYDRLVRK